MVLRLLSLVAVLALLLVLPSRAWAEGEHGHCEEPAASATPTVPAAMPSHEAGSGTTVGAPEQPCGNCPAPTCPGQDHCSAGASPCAAAAPPEATAPCADSPTAMPSGTACARSFHPTPPTPPPNLVAR